MKPPSSSVKQSIMGCEPQAERGAAAAPSAIIKALNQDPVSPQTTPATEKGTGRGPTAGNPLAPTEPGLGPKPTKQTLGVNLLTYYSGQFSASCGRPRTLSSL